jgi:LysM repeat protein
VIYSRRPIPAGYELRLPRGRVGEPTAFISRLRSNEGGRHDTAPVESAVAREPVGHITYVVRRGDTLYSISRRFSTSVDEIRKLNRLTHSRIIPGQRLLIGAR